MEATNLVGFSLQTGSVDDLVVNDELTTTIVDDEGAEASSAISKGLAETVPQVTLVDDADTLLDVASLGHGGDAAIITEVEDTVGLVNRTKHALDNDGRRWVRDEAGLLVELAGEDIDTEVSVLTGLRRDADADDLARTALEDQQVTHADEVAWDGDGVRGVASTRADNADVLANTLTHAGGATLFVGLLILVMVERVLKAVGCALHSTAEGVVVAVVVVVTHFAAGGVFDNSATV